jgi:hypothetical protein
MYTKNQKAFDSSLIFIITMFEDGPDRFSEDFHAMLQKSAFADLVDEEFKANPFNYADERLVKYHEAEQPEAGMGDAPPLLEDHRKKIDILAKRISSQRMISKDDLPTTKRIPIITTSPPSNDDPYAQINNASLCAFISVPEISSFTSYHEPFTHVPYEARVPIDMVHIRHDACMLGLFMRKRKLKEVMYKRPIKKMIVEWSITRDNNIHFAKPNEDIPVNEFVNFVRDCVKITVVYRIVETEDHVFKGSKVYENEAYWDEFSYIFENYFFSYYAK